jgi:hypothetical protein
MDAPSRRDFLAAAAAALPVAAQPQPAATAAGQEIPGTEHWTHKRVDGRDIRLFAWRRNGGTVFVAIGTRAKLYVYSAGTLSDVTPSGFSSGAVDASGTFYARTEAHSWQFDSLGDDLVACSYSDGRIVMWDSSVGVGTAAAAVTNAPTHTSP